MSWKLLTESMECSIGRLIAWTEAHPGLGGWVGAIGALLAIIATWAIANAQMRSDRRARKSQREQYIDLISGVVNDYEDLLSPFLVEARKGYSSQLSSYRCVEDLNTPEFHAALDLVKISVKDWPSIESFKCYKIYFKNVTDMLSQISAQKSNPDLTPQKIADVSNFLIEWVAIRDRVLPQLRSALHEARKLSI